MGFFRNLFRTAGEVAALSQQLAFYETRAKTAEWKCAELEKEVKAERKRFDKIQATFMDYVAKREGTQGKFTAVQTEPVVIEPEQLSLYEENKIEWLAQQMLQADIDSGQEPHAFHVYTDAIKSNPEKYLTAIN
jgi:hydroxyacyl-ACP dehydratase HTD2-like protein with hotdog domain